MPVLTFLERNKRTFEDIKEPVDEGWDRIMFRASLRVCVGLLDKGWPAPCHAIFI